MYILYIAKTIIQYNYKCSSSLPKLRTDLLSSGESFSHSRPIKICLKGTVLRNVVIPNLKYFVAQQTLSALSQKQLTISTPEKKCSYKNHIGVEMFRSNNFHSSWEMFRSYSIVG